MKAKYIYYLVITAGIAIVVLTMDACKVSEQVQAKSGAQLWSENCSRCHNVPSPTNFRDSQWETIGTHMRVRANLGATEADKIIEFLKTSN